MKKCANFKLHNFVYHLGLYLWLASEKEKKRVTFNCDSFSQTMQLTDSIVLMRSLTFFFISKQLFFSLPTYNDR